MINHYDYANAVLPILLNCTETKGAIAEYWVKNGPCGTVSAHGDKWMTNRDFITQGISSYKQVVLYLLFRCSVECAYGYTFSQAKRFITKWYEKLKHLLPDFENTIIEIEDHGSAINVRYVFGTYPTNWSLYEALSKDFKNDMLTPEYWRFHYYSNNDTIVIIPKIKYINKR